MLTILTSCVAFLAPQPDPTEERGAMPTPRSVVFQRGDRRITIDGNLNEWPSVPAVRLDDTRQISGTAFGAYTGPQDLTAQAFFLWDERDLYFAAKVVDDGHLKLARDTPQRTEIPPTDAIVLTFDPKRDTRSMGLDKGRQEDKSFWLSHTDEKQVIRWERVFGTGGIAEGARCAVTREDAVSLTTYEARIPWSQIFPDRNKAAVRDILDLQIVVSDFDVPGDPLPGTRIGWTFGTGMRIDPGILGTIQLVDRVADQGTKFETPDFPAPPSIPEPPVPDPAYWIRLHKNFGAHPPQIATLETVEPEFAGGKERKALLEELDRRMGEFPRVDFLQFQMWIHRRMVRECAGLTATGLPYYFDHVLGRVARAATLDSPEKGFRLFRLPHGGWLVRSKQSSFMIDPSGFMVQKQLWNFCDFVLLTAPNDVMRRNDQLLVRLHAAREPKRQTFMHILQSIPGIAYDEMKPVVPGKTYDARDLKVTVLGEVDERGWVTNSVGYFVRWPDGSSLLISGTETLSEHVPSARKPDIALVSAKHPRARVFGHRVQAKLIVLDDILQPATWPGPGGRVPIANAFTLQRELRPNASMILAPGESVDSDREGK